MHNTITLKFREIKLAPGDLYDVSKYTNGDGLYIVNDGIAHLLVSVVNSVIVSIPLPNRQILDEYARQAKSDAAQCERDILADLERKIKHFETMLSESLKGVAEAIATTASKKPETTLDLAGLTKMIAVAQKPDLVKGK